MGGQAQPQAPTLDTGKSKELTRAELEIKRKEIGPTTAAAGTASRDQLSRNLEFALRGFTNPASVVYGGQIADTNTRLGKLRTELKDLQDTRKSGGKWLGPKEYNKKVSDLEGRITNAEGRVKNLKDKDPVADLQKAFRPEFAARDRLLGDMEGARASSAEYTRYQDNLAEGGELGRRLMTEALGRSERGFGQLSAEAERNATQAARSGMAARGMATGSAGLGAELLNRDTYQRQRAAEDINFVGGVMNDERNRFGTSAQLSEMERGRQLALGQDAYNFRLSTNPKLMLAGLGSPYANMTGNAMQMVSGAQFTPQYSGGQFSSGGGLGTAGNIAAGAAGGAVMGAPLGPWGMAGGAVLGGGMAALS